MKHLLLLLTISSLIAACGSEKKQNEDPNRIGQFMGTLFKAKNTPQHYQSEEGKHFIKIYPDGRIEVDMTYTTNLTDYGRALERNELGDPLSTYEQFILDNLETEDVDCRFSYNGTIARFESYGGVSVGERYMELDILEIEMGYDHGVTTVHAYDDQSEEGQRLKNQIDETCKNLWEDNSDFRAGYSTLYVLAYSEEVLRLHPYINRPSEFFRLNRVAGKAR